MAILVKRVGIKQDNNNQFLFLYQEGRCWRRETNGGRRLERDLALRMLRQGQAHPFAQHVQIVAILRHFSIQSKNIGVTDHHQWSVEPLWN